MPRSLLRLSVLPLIVLGIGLLGSDCGTRMKVRAYEGDDRHEWQQTERVIETLALRTNDRIADIGSGSGFFTRPLAKAVPDGRVFAVDVDEAMNTYLGRSLDGEGITNVTVVLAKPDDPGLPKGEIDLIFTSNTFHHLPDQTMYFRSVMPALSHRGRVAIVEYQPETAGWFARTFDHATQKDAIVAALEAAGYRLIADHAFLERQNFLIFEPFQPPSP